MQNHIQNRILYGYANVNESGYLKKIGQHNGSRKALFEEKQITNTLFRIQELGQHSSFSLNINLR